MEFNGTKRDIFLAAIELFSQKSFESVAIKDIAKKIGKHQGGIYYHFESKQDILDNIYDYFEEHFFEARLTLAQIEPVLRDGSLSDIIRAINFDFPPEHILTLQAILRILDQRKYADERARQITKDILHDACIKYAEDVLNRAIEIGRFFAFDTHYVSLACNFTRQATYNRWILEPTMENLKILMRDENILFEYMMKMVSMYQNFDNTAKEKQ